MEEKQLKMLEDRINNAITFIENLKIKEKVLIEERDEIRTKYAELEETIQEKDLKIEALKENQLFLKNKIEAILSKLESLADLEAEGAYSATEADRPGEEEGEEMPFTNEEETVEVDDEGNPYEEERTESSEIIIEENMVDLKENKEEETLDESYEEAENEEPEEIEGRGDISDQQSMSLENSLFEPEESGNKDTFARKNDNKPGASSSKYDDKPYIGM